MTDIYEQASNLRRENDKLIKLLKLIIDKQIDCYLLNISSNVEEYNKLVAKPFTSRGFTSENHLDFLKKFQLTEKEFNLVKIHFKTKGGLL